MFYEAHTFNLDTNNWSKTPFEKRKDALSFVKNHIKYPGEYNLKYTQGVWNEQACIFQENERINGHGSYPKYVKKSTDYNNHWTFEEEKCFFEGFLIYKKPSENLEYVVPCLYYWYLNYCPIPDKVKQKDDFPEIYDGDLHYYLYILECILVREFGVVLKKRQSGYQQPKSQLVMKKDSWVTIGSLLPGDFVMNPDGTEQLVTEIFPQGIKDVYEVEFIDGRKSLCGEEHLWYVLDKRAKKWKVLQTNEIIKLGVTTETTAPTKLGTKIYPSYRFAIPLTNPMPFSAKKQIVDAYLLGQLLGNGSLGQGVRITTPDLETVERVSKIVGDDYRLVIESDRSDKKQCRYRFTYKYAEHIKHPNPLTKAIFDIGLEGTNTYTKFIPENYLHGSIKQRIALIQGLMDSDGYINTEGKDIQYTSINLKLAEQFTYVARSLGLNCRIDKKDKQKETHQDFYRVRISGPINFDLFRLTRKLERQKKRKNEFKNLPIVSIKKLDYQEDSVCISVDNPNHLYVTNDFVVTHNTLKNMSIKACAIWFGRGVMSKIFAYDENKVKESWAFMTQYRDHNNRYCAWTRTFDPSKLLDWNMRRKQKDGSYRGRNCQAKGFTTKQNFSNGIGGSAKVIFGEESGANPTLDKTHEFITSNVSYGGLTTGLIIYSGAVGELDQAEPLKEFILRPGDNGFVARPNNIEADLELGSEVGFFAPEWWNYVSVERDEDDKPIGEALKCFDKWGNSNKELAISEITKWRKLAEKKSPEKYRYYCSQRPLSITEAFAFRKESIFPLNLVAAQKRRIENKEYPHEYLTIEKNEYGVLEFKKSSKFPIREFPLKKTSTDKEGCIEVWERPCDNPTFGMYYASVDPLREGKTTSSDSLFCILIYKNDVEVTRISGDKTETYIEPGKLVASWTGRFDDINDTNKRGQYLIEIYNAWALVEANASEFTNHMIHQKKQHLLVPKDQIMFLKDLGANLNAFQEYGWKNTGVLFKNHMLPYGVGFLKEEIDVETGTDGEVKRRVYGIERIPDIMIMKEMEAYHDGLNVDRLISFCSLVSFIRIQNANRGYIKRVERDDSYKKANLEIYKKQSSFFKTKPQLDTNSPYNIKKSAFRNLK